MKIVELSDYRRKRRAGSRYASAPDAAPVYYCKRCDADHFRLRASGEVHCANCGALMSNVLVAPAQGGNRGKNG